VTALTRFVLQVVGWAVGLPLEILVILAIFRGPYRRYPIVFLFVLVDFATTLVDIALNTQSFLTHDPAVSHLAAKVYWINEWVLQVLIFATVLSLIDLATFLSRSRRIMRVGLGAGALLFAGITFWIHFHPAPVKIGVWMTPWTRDMSVCATVLDLALWMILIASPKSDRSLMLISGGLGMQFTAEAIGEAVVNLSAAPQSQVLALIGAIIVAIGNLLCLYVWWQTFRAIPSPAKAERH